MKAVPLFVLLICVTLCCDAVNTRTPDPLGQIAKKLNVVGRLEAKIESVVRRARGLDYDVHKMYDMKFKCTQALEKWDEDALLAAVYEVDKAMIEGTFTLWDLSKDTTEFLLAIAGDTINVRTPTFKMETDKMDKTFLRVFDGFMRAAVASSPIGDNYKSWIDKEVQGALDDKKPALLGKDVEEGKKLADKVFQQTDRVYRSRIDNKQKKKEKFPASCTLMDVVLTSHRDRLIENTVINTNIRDAVTSSINIVTNLAVTGLIAGSGVTVGVNPGVSFGLGIAAGAVKLGGALTEMITEKAIKANDAVKEFRRGIRIQLIEALRAILNEGKCHDKFYDMMKLLHTMMVKEQFDGITRKEIRKTLTNDCVVDKDDYSEYIWVADLLQNLTKEKLKRDKVKLDIEGLKANEVAAMLPDLGDDIGDRVGKAITPPTPAKK